MIRLTDGTATVCIENDALGRSESTLHPRLVA